MPPAYLAPDPVQSTQFIPGGNVPASGALLFCYQVGSSTKQNTYTDPSASTARTNPIVLDSGGNIPGNGEVWITSTAKFVLAPSNDTDPPVSPYWSRDNLPGVNNPASIQTEWIPFGGTPLFVNASTFVLGGDQSGLFTPQRRLQTINTGGTRYSTVTSSIFATSTTIGIASDTAGLDAGLNSVSYGMISSFNDSLPYTISVTRFGAKGDGVTNDTVAIQAALDSLSSTGGSIYLPRGTYLISRIDMKFSNVTLCGDGPASILLQTVSPGTGAFGATGAAIQIHPSTGSFGAWGTNITDVTVRDLYIKGQQTLTHTYAANLSAIIADAADNVRILRNKISGFVSENILISPGTRGDFPIVEDNIVTNGGDGVGINKSFGAIVRGNQVHDTWTQHGIGCSGSGWIIEGNILQNTWMSCIFCGGSGIDGITGEENIINGNVCVGASQAGSGNGYGIFLSDDGATTVVKKTYLASGNIVDKTNSNFGVNVTLQSVSSKVYFSGNYITGTLDAGSRGFGVASGNATYYLQGNTIIGDANQTFGITGGASATVYINGNIVRGHSVIDINASTGFVIGSNVITNGLIISGTTSTPISFYGFNVTTQPNVGTTVTTTPATSSTPWGFSTSAQANALILQVSSLAFALKSLGLSA